MVLAHRLLVMYWRMGGGSEYLYGGWISREGGMGGLMLSRRGVEGREGGVHGGLCLLLCLTSFLF